MKHTSQRLGGAVVAVSSLILAMLTSPVSAAPGAAVGDGSPIGDNQLAWPGSGTPAGAVGATGTVVEVALRPPFTRADLLSGHPGAVAAARDATDAAVAANPGHDLVIMVDREGNRILGDDSQASGPGAESLAEDNALSFTFNSPSAPWTDAEVTAMQAALAEFYPDAVEIYGPPFYDICVNVRKVPGMGGGAYNSVLNEATMGGVDLDVLAHEMVHAFRDDQWIWLPTFEEGMARAVEVELFSRSPYTHWDAGHSYYYDRAYEELNDHANGSPSGGFSDNWLERYQLAGYAWWKALVDRPAFLPAFNAAYLDLRLAGGSYVEKTLVDLAEATIGGPVEGRPFRSWYDQQSVLDTRPPAVTYLHLRYGAAYAMTRTVTGQTRPLSGATISWVARDVTGAVVDHGSELTPTGGIYLRPKLPPGHPGGRIDVEMTTTDPNGLLVQRRVPIPLLAVGGDGVVGVVTSGTEGSVTITALDGQAPAVTVPVLNGAFSAPELRGVRGRFLAVYSPPSGPAVSRQFTRDTSEYRLVLAAPNLSVKLTAKPDLVAPGETVRYRARVDVAGPSPANGVSFRLETPVGASVTGVGADRGSCAVLTRNETPVCWFEGMAPGTGADIWVDVVLGAEGVHTATASVVASELDPVYADDVASVDTTVTTTPDTTAPDATISAPAPASIVSPGSVLIAGDASDDRVVARVDVSVKNTTTGQWLQADGTFGPLAWLPAVLDAPGESDTGFSLDVRLVRGAIYLVEAAAYDPAGNTDLDRPRTTFTIPADTTPPGNTVAIPEQDGTYPAGTLNVAGTATDDRAVDRVDISVQNLATKKWRHADGTWGVLEWLPAGLNSPGDTSTSWSLAVAGLTPGSYGLRAVARDVAGLKDVAPVWVRFTVVAPDTSPPDGTIASPRANQTVRPGPLSFRGSASDNRAVASVQIAIQNRGTGRWRRLDGTWGPTPTWLPPPWGRPEEPGRPGPAGTRCRLATSACGSEPGTPPA